MAEVSKAKKSKKLPKRASRDNVERRYARMWAAARIRRNARIAASLERAAKNKELRAAGLLTPWEVAKAKRFAARH